ncbi:hypothetical protein KR100_10600 [Synechococcus sp. KORDI-100]|nr:hypothetical protein KR100_10600 [Synechococcus sp. KORDI-100]
MVNHGFNDPSKSFEERCIRHQNQDEEHAL